MAFINEIPSPIPLDTSIELYEKILEWQGRVAQFLETEVSVIESHCFKNQSVSWAAVNPDDKFKRRIVSLKCAKQVGYLLELAKTPMRDAPPPFVPETSTFDKVGDEKHTLKLSIPDNEVFKKGIEAGLLKIQQVQERKQGIEKVVTEAAAEIKDYTGRIRLPSFAAVLKAGAANLTTNEEVVEVCKQIENRGYGHPFLDSGVPEEDYLEFLRFCGRAMSIPYSPKAIYVLYVKFKSGKEVTGS